MGETLLTLLQALQAKVEAAGARRDAAAIAAMYTPDAVLIAQDGQWYEGTTEIEAFWKATAEALESPKISTRAALPLSSDLVQEEGVFTAGVRASPGETAQGGYTVVWRKTDAGWKMATDVIR
jgi:uncharacterized protein (TIGR02246 family)